MKQIKQAAVLVFVLGLMAFIMSQCLGGTPPQSYEESLGQLPQQQSELPFLSEGTWRLDTFENLAVEVDGQMYDRGLFTNVDTGEQIWARCLDPTKEDPVPGDLFFQQDGLLYPSDGDTQRFEALFQILPTETVVPTPETTATTLAIVFPTQETGNGLLLPIGTPQPEPAQSEGLKPFPWVIFGVWLVLPLVVALFVAILIAIRVIKTRSER